MSKQNNLREWFSIRDAARLSGLTVGMIDYLARAELLHPEGPDTRCRGKHRQYSFADVVMLRAIQRMLEAGLTVKRLKSSLVELDAVRRTITPEELPADLLLTDGKDVYFRRTKDVLEQITNGQLTFAFVIEMNRIRLEVTSNLIIKSEKTGFRYKLRRSAD